MLHVTYAAKPLKLTKPGQEIGPLPQLVPDIRNTLYLYMNLQSLGSLASTCRDFYKDLARDPGCRIWIPEKWRYEYLSSPRLLPELHKVAIQVIEGMLRPKGFLGIPGIGTMLSIGIKRTCVELSIGSSITSFHYGSGQNYNFTLDNVNWELVDMVLAVLRAERELKLAKKAFAQRRMKLVPEELRTRERDVKKQIKSVRRAVDVQTKNVDSRYLTSATACGAFEARLRKLLGEVVALKLTYEENQDIEAQVEQLMKAD